MNRPVRRAIGNALLAAALLACLANLGIAARNDWRIMVNETDLTTQAAQRQGAAILVNLARLAPHLGLQVTVQGREAVIANARQDEWRASDGEAWLAGPGGRSELRQPLTIEGSSVYVPLEALAEVAGLRLTLDSVNRVAWLAPTLAVGAALEGGWETFTLEKSAKEKRESARMRGDGSGKARAQAIQTLLPPQHDKLRLQVGQGYILGADAGTDLNASGGLYGMAFSGNTLLTTGSQGIRPLGGRAALTAPDGRWQLEGGDLFSNIWGLARGVRYGWGRTGNLRQDVGLYLQSDRSGRADEPKLSYGSEWTVAKILTLGGELNSDRSHYMQSSIQAGNLSLNGFYRYAAPDDARGHGVSAGYSLFRRVSLQARSTTSGAGLNRLTWNNASVRFGLPKGADLTLDYTDAHSATSRQKIAATAVGAPAGPVRVRVRVQKRDQILLAGRNGLERELRTENYEVMGSASWFGSRRLNLDFQSTQRWQPTGRLETWRQLIATLRLSRVTDMQLISSVPDVANPQQMRLRVSHWMREDLGLSFDYGNVPTYQQSNFEASDRMARVMLRKLFNVATPAGGTTAEGRVTDHLNQPLREAVVTVGPYSVATDEDGRFSIAKLPAGSYTVSVDERSIPANYTVLGDSFELHTRSTRKAAFDFTAAPLGVIRGTVYADKNGNGRPDPGEGVPGVPVFLGDAVTASGPDGRYSFHNLRPGVHGLRLEAERLGAEWELVSASEREITLEPGAEPPGQDFVLTEKVKPIMFQELEESQP